MAGVDTLGVDLRTRTKLLGEKEASSGKVHDDSSEELVEDGLGLVRAWRGQTVGIAHAERRN